MLSKQHAEPQRPIAWLAAHVAGVAQTSHHSSLSAQPQEAKTAREGPLGWEFCLSDNLIISQIISKLKSTSIATVAPIMWM